MLDNDINSLYGKNKSKIINKKKFSSDIKLLNYTWKKMYKMMNKIKKMWYMNLFDINFNLDMQKLYKIIYQNLQFCDKEPNLKLKNNIIESNYNSFFQSNLLEILPNEKNMYDLYDNLFSEKKYIPKKDGDNMSLFEDFIINYKELFYKIEKNKKSKKQLKKMRWYFIIDKSNFFEDQPNIINNKGFIIDFSDEVEDLDDSCDEIEKNAILKEYENNKNNKIVDNLDELYEKYIIDDKLVDKLLKLEKNKFFYLIKLIYLSINIFCKSIISHLLFIYLNSEEKQDSQIILINEYIKSFNNFVDTCTIINEKCANVNLAMNYLYKSLFEDIPNIPKFSIYRMCLKIWFTEINTHILGQNTLLYEINSIISSVFSENLKEELLNKMEEKNQNYSYKTKSVNNEKTNNFNFSTSYTLFGSFTKSNNFEINNFNNDFGSVNLYNNVDKQYKILEKGLSIVNDTFLNEYSAYFLNFSMIDINTFYDNIVYGFEETIKFYIEKVFNKFIYNQNISIKIVLDNILEYFDNYFYKNFIIPNLRNKIYETVFLCVKHYLMKLAKDKYLDVKNEINTQNISMISSVKTNWCSNNNLKTSSIFGLDDYDLEQNFNINDNFEVKTEEYKQEIINYIIKNISNDKNDDKSLYSQIEQKLETINEQINLYDLFISNIKWHNKHLNMIEENDNKVYNEISKIKIKLKIDIPFKYEQINRYLLSYSLQYDWDFIKKAKILIKYNKINNIDTENIEYMDEEDEYDNIGPDNNGEINLKQSFFGF